MEIKHRVQNKIAIVSLTGEFTMDDSESFGEYVASFTTNTGIHKVLINCKQLTFISASGIEQLSSCHRELEENGKGLMLCAMDSHIKELVDVMGVPNTLMSFRNQEDALEFSRKSTK